MSRTVRVDDVDRRIVAALQRDGRRPFTSIGRELGLSEAAVRQRVARLQAAGIMQVVAVADPMTLGYKAMAMVAISVDGRARKACGIDEDTVAVSSIGVSSVRTRTRRSIPNPVSGAMMSSARQVAV